MTENKRFIQKDEAIINIMTDELVTASSVDSAEIIVDWLNRIFEKNGELSKENYGLQDGLDFYREQNAYLSEQINELEQKLELYEKQEERIKELGKENKQLQIEVLGQSEEIEVLSDENKRLRCINKQLEERVGRSVALDMGKCGDVNG